MTDQTTETPEPQDYISRLRLRRREEMQQSRSKAPLQMPTQVLSNEQEAAQELQKQQQATINALAAEVAPKMDIAEMFNFNGRTLKVLVRKNGQADLTVNLNRNGTLNCQPVELSIEVPLPDSKYEWTQIWNLPFLVIEAFVDQYIELSDKKLRAFARKQYPTKKLTKKFLADKLQNSSNWSMPQDVAETALLQACGIDYEPKQSMTNGLDPMKMLEAAWHTIVDTKWASEIQEMLNGDYVKREEPTIAQYNLLVTHKKVIMETRLRATSLAVIWFHHITRELPDEPCPDTYQQLEARLREYLEITQEEMELLTGTARNAISVQWECESMEQLRQLTTALRVTVTSKCQPDNSCIMSLLFTCGEDLRTIWEGEWSHGDPQATLLNLITTHVAREDHPKTRHSAEQDDNDRLEWIKQASSKDIQKLTFGEWYTIANQDWERFMGYKQAEECQIEPVFTSRLHNLAKAVAENIPWDRKPDQSICGEYEEYEQEGQNP